MNRADFFLLGVSLGFIAGFAFACAVHVLASAMVLFP